MFRSHDGLHACIYGGHMMVQHNVLCARMRTATCMLHIAFLHEVEL